MIYHVNSRMTRYGPVYVVENEEGVEMPGEFDSSVNAQDLADYLNKREEEKGDD